MDLKIDSEEVSIRYVPVRKWVVGGILALAIVVFSIWLVYVFYNRWAGMLFPSAFAAVTILIAVLDIKANSLIFAPLITVKINQETRSVEIVRQRFYGKRIERFYFYQIRKFRSRKANVNFSGQYFLTLILASGKALRLGIPIGNDKQDTAKFIKQLNKFIRRKAPSAK